MEYTFWSEKRKLSHYDIWSLNPYFNGIYFLISQCKVVSEEMDVVLILILMEYTFWSNMATLKEFRSLVLILILMEYTFWCLGFQYELGKSYVLILILMEYTFWSGWIKVGLRENVRLNPYFNGIYFLI